MFDDRRAAGESAVGVLLEQARAAFGAFTSVPDRSAFYQPEMPLLDPVSSLLFVLGIGAALFARSTAGLLLAVWLAAVPLLGGMLLIDPPHSPRYVVAAPAACLAVALGLDAVRRSLRRRLPPLGGEAAVAAVVAALLLWNVHFYFRVYSERVSYGGGLTEEAAAVGRYVGSLDGGRYVYFFGALFTYLAHGSIRFLGDGFEGVDVLEPVARAADLPPLPPGSAPVFVFLPHRLGEAAVVGSSHPGGRALQSRSGATGRILFVAYEAPPVP